MHLRGSWLALLCIPLLAALITNDLQRQPTTTGSIRSLAEAGSAGAEVSLLPLQPGSVVAVADLHGDLLKAHAALQLLQLVDQQHNWAAQGVTLVQLGDMVDRGPHSLQLLQLFRRLQAQAPSASSRVELLLGNHELMLLQQDLRYFSRQELQRMGEEGAAAAAAAAGVTAAVSAAGTAQVAAVEGISGAQGDHQQTAEGGASAQTHVSSGRSMQQQQRLEHHPPPQQEQGQARPPPAAEVVEVLQHQGQPPGLHRTPSSSSSSGSDLMPQECGTDHTTAAGDTQEEPNGREQPSELRRLHQRRLLHVISNDAGSIRPPALTLPVPHVTPPGTPLVAGSRHQHHQQHQSRGVLIRFDSSTGTGNDTTTSTTPPASSSSHQVEASPHNTRAQARRMAALAHRSLLNPPPRQLKSQQDAVLAGFAVLGELLNPGVGSLWQQLVQRQLVAVAGKGGCATAFVHAGLTIRALEHLLAQAPPQYQEVLQPHQQPHKRLGTSGAQEQQQLQPQHERQLQEQGVDGTARNAEVQPLAGAQVAAWVNAAAHQALSSCTPRTCSTTITSSANEGAGSPPTHRPHIRGGPAHLPPTSTAAAQMDTAGGPVPASIHQPPAAPAVSRLPATDTVGGASDHLSEQQLAGFWSAMTSGKGPVWNRVLATAADAVVCPGVTQVCRVLGVHRLVVGHTPQTNGRAAVRCAGRLLLLDTGMSIGIYNSTPAGFVCTPGTAAAAAVTAGLERRLHAVSEQQVEDAGAVPAVGWGLHGLPTAHDTLVEHATLGGAPHMLPDKPSAAAAAAAARGGDGGQGDQQRRARSLATEAASDRQFEDQQQQQRGMHSSSCRAAVLYGDGWQQDLPCGGDAL